MDLIPIAARLNPAASYQTAPAEHSDNPSSFEGLMGELQVKADIVAHLQGVPGDTVTIAPNVIKKMAEDKAVYQKMMDAIDDYVKGYKTYHGPGVLTMSFRIDEKGVPCISGVNEILARQTDKSEDQNKSLNTKSLYVCSNQVQLPYLTVSDSAFSMMSALYDYRVKRSDNL